MDCLPACLPAYMCLSTRACVSVNYCRCICFCSLSLTHTACVLEIKYTDILFRVLFACVVRLVFGSVYARAYTNWHKHMQLHSHIYKQKYHIILVALSLSLSLSFCVSRIHKSNAKSNGHKRVPSCTLCKYILFRLL